MDGDGENSGVHWPLNVTMSTDSVLWPSELTLENVPRKDRGAYPAAIEIRAGLMHCISSWNPVKIKHVVVKPRHP